MIQFQSVHKAYRVAGREIRGWSRHPDTLDWLRGEHERLGEDLEEEPE